MNPGSEEDAREIRHVGLCAVCCHVKRIPSARGLVFFMCRLGLTDPSFEKYPVLPVVCCQGFKRDPPPA